MIESNAVKQSNTKFTTKDLVECALLTALIFVATRFINITLPISMKGGLIHLGTGMLFISSIVFGEKKGAISGAFGMAIFDILSGWAVWAPFTFVIRGIMGYMLGKISHINGKNGNSIVANIIAMLISTIWMIIGYYFTEVILYGNWITPFTSMPGDLAQGIVGAIIALPIIKGLKRVYK
ncbi:ECF transporter S component [Peptostreptococcus porci]|uniref:ECF transporter S component n=1 Tax=Peptostreptococcus porci TaxID=2652282 RepID=UPI002A908D25|nr:ECF transporter S component [Peptostreptococcus porci]MDY5436183.1 ECF transporter S component [Peptostreptococcus porci]